MSADSQFAAMLDAFGRIWIWSVLRCRFIRNLKGYRRAQIAWCSVNGDDVFGHNLHHRTASRVGVSEQQQEGRSLDVQGVTSNDDIPSDRGRNGPNFGRRSGSVSHCILVIYIESRGLVEFHGVNALKRLYAVKVPENGELIQSINFAVSPATSFVVLSVRRRKRSGKMRKIYKLTVNRDLVKSGMCCLNRRGTDRWLRSEALSSSIVFLSDFEFVFDGKRSDRESVFGRKRVISTESESEDKSLYQWFVAVIKCDGDLCIGLQRDDGIDESKFDGDFCDEASGWGYHCDGFMKNNGSFTRYEWKYGQCDTVGVLLTVSAEGSSLQFALNGTLCPQSACKLPDCTTMPCRLAVSVGLNSFAQLLLIGFSKS